MIDNQTAQKPEEAVAVQLCYLPDNLAEKFTVWASLHLLTYYQMPKKIIVKWGNFSAKERESFLLCSVGCV